MADYPWYKSYDAGVPHSIAPYPDNTIVDIFTQTAKEMPDHRFIIYKDRDISYAEGVKIADTLAAALQASGV